MSDLTQSWLCNSVLPIRQNELYIDWVAKYKQGRGKLRQNDSPHKES